MTRYHAIVVGAGHNGLVAATMLARAGRSVLLLERLERAGGAAVSGSPWPGVGAHVSRYAYLVSLLPSSLREELGLPTQLLRRSIGSYTPVGDTGLLVCDDEQAMRDSFARVTGERAGSPFAAWQGLYATLGRAAARLAPTLTSPLQPRSEMQRRLADAEAWEALFEQPLSVLLERTFDDDTLRGVALTDATIGTFAPASDPGLRQNRCFLYHVIGDGDGLWRVPAGGMGTLTDGLVSAARAAGAELRTETEVTSIHCDGGREVEVVCTGGSRHRGAHLLANVAPAVLGSLLEQPLGAALGAPEGSQLKINMLLRRLPRLRDPDVRTEQAFAGTFHVNESYEQLQSAYEQADAGRIPTLPPCEMYCHSLTDPTILSAGLRAAGAHTLTLFGLHMPARLFAAEPAQAKRLAVEATLRSVESVLAEPLEPLLWRDQDGRPCLEAVTPVELEAQLSMPGGHIFHRDLSWPFAESEAEVGRWGVETEHPNIWLCGAGARRGGGVSGIPGHNAARAVLSAAGGVAG